LPPLLYDRNDLLQACIIGSDEHLTTILWHSHNMIVAIENHI
jgi:hypothetical protein